MRELFLESYPLGLQAESSNALALKRTALISKSCFLSWACFESAQLCVLNKLRTSLGKAPDTFTAFETALKILAKDYPDHLNLAECVETVTRGRVLLEFMEWLEKVSIKTLEIFIFNMVPSKKSFFLMLISCIRS